MKMNIAGIIAFVMFLIISCNPKVKETQNDSLNGMWSLQIMEKYDSNANKWYEWKDGMQGYLLYEKSGYMSLHLLTKAYENTDLRFPNFTDTISLEALKHLTGSYVYMAKYRLDTVEKIVTHSRLSHSNPGDWNKVVKRNYRFSGDTLIIQPAEESNALLRLKWLKIN